MKRLADPITETEGSPSKRLKSDTGHITLKCVDRTFFLTYPLDFIEKTDIGISDYSTHIDISSCSLFSDKSIKKSIILVTHILEFGNLVCSKESTFGLLILIAQKILHELRKLNEWNTPPPFNNYRINLFNQIDNFFYSKTHEIMCYIARANKYSELFGEFFTSLINTDQSNSYVHTDPGFDILLANTHLPRHFKEQMLSYLLRKLNQIINKKRCILFNLDAMGRIVSIDNNNNVETNIEKVCNIFLMFFPINIRCWVVAHRPLNQLHENNISFWSFTKVYADLEKKYDIYLLINSPVGIADIDISRITIDKKQTKLKINLDEIIFSHMAKRMIDLHERCPLIKTGTRYYQDSMTSDIDSPYSSFTTINTYRFGNPLAIPSFPSIITI